MTAARDLPAGAAPTEEAGLEQRRRWLIRSWTGAVAIIASGCGGGSSAAPVAGPPPAPPPTPAPPPPPPPPPPPSWVPRPGALADLLAVNGWNDIDPCPANNCGYRIGSGPEWNKVIDDYSGGVYNPHWGPLGALMFHGGGHAATNDNSVGVLDFNDLRFKLAADPSREVSGIRPGDGPTYPGLDRQYGEYVVDRKPAAAHTYDALEILPPEVSGTPFGALVRPFATAMHVNLSIGTSWAHVLALRSRDVGTAEGRADNTWSRFSASAGQGFGGAGGACAYDPLRKRVWWTGVPSQQPNRVAYLDCVTREQVSVRYGSGNAIFDVSLPIMRYIPGHDLIVSIGPRPGRSGVEAYFMRPDAPSAGWRAISMDLVPPVSTGCTPWDVVPELDRLFLFTQADRSAAYEIAIPADPASTWSVVRRPFADGASLATGAHVVGKRLSWAPALRCLVFKPRAALPSPRQFYTYRPPGT